MLQVIDLGRVPYREALAVQRETHDSVVAGDQPPTLLLVEHDPVITLGRRGKREHIIADVDRLGIDVVETDRGGDVTYHGPGQLVAYPVFKLSDLKLNVGSYMHLLHQVVIDALAEFDIAAHRDACAVGVWVGPGAGAKICAMGVRIRRGVSMHGLALNVSCDLDHFRTIIPCGLVDRPVTSLLQLAGDAAPSMDHVKAALVDAFRRGLPGQT